jgi:hypothetical protein
MIALGIPERTEWQRIGNQTKAALIFAGLTSQTCAVGVLMANEIAYSNRANDLVRDQAFATQSLSVMPARGMHQRNRLPNLQQFRGFVGQRIPGLENH